jgi:hypothetical protein
MRGLLYGTNGADCALRDWIADRGEDERRGDMRSAGCAGVYGLVGATVRPAASSAFTLEPSVESPRQARARARASGGTHRGVGSGGVTGLAFNEGKRWFNNGANAVHRIAGKGRESGCEVVLTVGTVWSLSLAGGCQVKVAASWLLTRRVHRSQVKAMC